jgi:hypothetical protein
MTYADLITDAAPSPARNGVVWLLAAVALFLWVAVPPVQLFLELG